MAARGENCCCIYNAQRRCRFLRYYYYCVCVFYIKIIIARPKRVYVRVCLRVDLPRTVLDAVYYNNVVVVVTTRGPRMTGRCRGNK